MTRDILGPEYGRTQSGEPGSLSYIENQLRAMAPYNFELIVSGGDLIIRVGSQEHQRDMEDLMRQHRNTLLPVMVAYRVEIDVMMPRDRNTDLSTTNQRLDDDRQIVNERDGVLHVDLLAGTHVSVALDFLMRLSRNRKKPATTNFNGQVITVDTPRKDLKLKRTAEQPRQRRRINLGDD